MSDSRRISECCEEIHRWFHGQGFYGGSCKGDGKCVPLSGSVAAAMMLVVTECSEAVEAHRCGNDGDFREQFADVVIRMFDLAYAWGIDLDVEIEEKMAKNWGRPKKHGKLY